MSFSPLYFPIQGFVKPKQHFSEFSISCSCKKNTENMTNKKWIPPIEYFASRQQITFSDKFNFQVEFGFREFKMIKKLQLPCSELPMPYSCRKTYFKNAQIAKLDHWDFIFNVLLEPQFPENTNFTINCSSFLDRELDFSKFTTLCSC